MTSEECPTVLSKLQAWIKANPLKVQALLALFAGSLPETAKQVLAILL